jgi:hypothetical protein
METTRTPNIGLRTIRDRDAENAERPCNQHTSGSGHSATLTKVVLAVLAAALIAACSAAGPTADPTAANIATTAADGTPHGVYDLPAQLPSHLGIGLSADLGSGGLGGWVPDSHIPFDYVYQYLAGGVNTGQGWQTWDLRAGFPVMYASEAASQHHVPVFSYYMIEQSKLPCSCDEAQGDLTKLNDRAVMAAYFEDFRTLMQRLGPGTWGGVKGFGGTVIVQVEPDLSGYAEQAVLNSRVCYGYCTGWGNNPSLLAAAVSNTGVADVRGFPNTYLGFNEGLLHLRDLYAPNVLLAFHESPWSTGQAVGVSSSTSLDAARLGRVAGSFAALSGVDQVKAKVSTYNLVFTDVADHDAELTGIWWDPTNRHFPDFVQWEQYVGASVSVFRRPVFVWQVPLGNQWFDTENGSYGHTQDNRIQYFFAHPEQLMNAGIAAVLFGAGNAGSTTSGYTQNVAVNNLAPTCHLLYRVETCADHRPIYADDDGGYLRIRSMLYYQRPVALTPAGS